MKNYITVQDREFIEQDGSVWTCASECISPHWRAAFGWMKDRYREIIGHDGEFELLWAWEAVEVPASKAYIAKVALEQFPVIENACEMVVLEFAAESDLVLPSSYARWNTFLDYCLLFKRCPSCREDWMGMFDCDDLADHDKTQGALPMIRQEWVTRITHVSRELLNETGGGSALRDLPQPRPPAAESD